ncbi:PREDICTED: titin-like isoform X1 [Trachymyrmex cornetzi]|uniref:titin-like isoform X1 n=1 Tax=Trachymyrmex cornetzi TaxID=471704 RepID=UPI00084EF85D|nr:PREDICTED: titin-like isoform X1 [Trachymyrmex cornetzi]
MSCNNSIKNRCPVTCPKVREQLRIAIEELPNVTDGIFPRKRNDVEPRLPSDINSRAIRDKPKHVIETAHVPINDVRSEELKDIKAKLVVFPEFPIVTEPTVIPTEKGVNDTEEKIDLEKEESIKKPTIIPEETVIPIKEEIDRYKEKIDLVEEIIQKEIIIPTEEIDRDEKKINLITEEEKIDQKPVIVQKKTVSPIERIADRNDEKIDFVEEKDLIVEGIAEEPTKKVPIEKPEIIKNEIEQAPGPKIELEPSRELEEHLVPEEPMEYDEEEEGKTDYEQYIDEELQEFLPAVIAREIPEEPRAVRTEISRNAATLYEKIDRERPVRPPREREAVTAMPEERPIREEVSVKRAPENSRLAEQIVSRKPAVVEDACEETCPLVKEQKERIMRKLKMRQRVVDHYYLTKGFSYFEDVCTCSLACMVYTLSRDPFVKSIFASFALFAVGLKLCSELDAWEMPNRVS